MRRTGLALVTVLALTTSASAANLTIGDIGNSTTLTFNGLVGGTTLVPELGASLTFTLDNVNAATNTWNFSYNAANITVAPFTSEFSAFGFNTDPALTGVGATGLYGKALMNVNVSGGIGLVDFCATAGPTCNGGASNGLVPGASALGTFSLDFAGSADASTAIALSDFFVRYQAIGGPGYDGASGVGVVTVPGPVVGAGLPGLLAAGFGLLGLNWHRRRRNGSHLPA